ncbi:MAG TPA: ATP-dependent Clp protease ATP-binding subunit ClpX, partial [Bacteroidota bacterium]|nr:ATP-dependent Clp protease ATP-binding subunit ClpX [Bacteroidota bacterium]
YSTDEYLKQVEPDDLLKYGLIPEFVGRLPVLTTLKSLSEEAMMSILTEPKNALVKQYQKLMKYEGVDLEFEPDALRAVVKKAIKRGTGARALRSILENIMTDIMYELPSKANVTKCAITEETITKGAEPMYVIEERKSA